VERDEALRASCFLALDALRAQFPEDLPLVGGLQQGFVFRGTRVPFLNYQKGIYRAAAQRGRAALAIVTSAKRPYDDEETDEGFWYAYRAAPIDHLDNKALRLAHELRVPIAYFVASRPGWYSALYPCFVVADDPSHRRVLVTTGKMYEGHPIPVENRIERGYAVRETRVRLHQARFRGLVLPAYGERCAICRLREISLLDAAHITPDRTPEGVAAVRNGVSLCTIHHRAYDQDLVGISPDYDVHVARRLLEDDDGPMLELLKGFHGSRIEFPRRPLLRPDPDRLAQRFERFASA
jgi:putative restriction endonuclease